MSENESTTPTDDGDGGSSTSGGSGGSGRGRPLPRLQSLPAEIMEMVLQPAMLAEQQNPRCLVTVSTSGAAAARPPEVLAFLPSRENLAVRIWGLAGGSLLLLSRAIRLFAMGGFLRIGIGGDIARGVNPGRGWAGPMHEVSMPRDMFYLCMGPGEDTEPPSARFWALEGLCRAPWYVLKPPFPLTIVPHCYRPSLIP